MLTEERNELVKMCAGRGRGRCGGNCVRARRGEREARGEKLRRRDRRRRRCRRRRRRSNTAALSLSLSLSHTAIATTKQIEHAILRSPDSPPDRDRTAIPLTASGARAQLPLSLLSLREREDTMAADAGGIKVITSKEEMRNFTRALKREGKTVGFVPTMVR